MFRILLSLSYQCIQVSFLILAIFYFFVKENIFAKQFAKRLLILLIFFPKKKPHTSLFILFIKVIFKFCSFLIVFIFPLLLSFFFQYNFIYLFLSVLGLQCSVQALSGWSNKGYSLLVCRWFPLGGFSCCREQAQELWCTDISYSDTGGILQDQGLNPGLLHWQADSLSGSHQEPPGSHQGSPRFVFFCFSLWKCSESLDY